MKNRLELTHHTERTLKSNIIFRIYLDVNVQRKKFEGFFKFLKNSNKNSNEKFSKMFSKFSTKNWKLIFSSSWKFFEIHYDLQNLKHSVIGASNAHTWTWGSRWPLAHVCSRGIPVSMSVCRCKGREFESLIRYLNLSWQQMNSNAFRSRFQIMQESKYPHKKGKASKFTNLSWMSMFKLGWRHLLSLMNAFFRNPLGYLNIIYVRKQETKTQVDANT